MNYINEIFPTVMKELDENKRVQLYNRRKRMMSKDGVLFGKPRTGKTLFMKSEILQELSNPDTTVFIIDSKGEYSNFTEKLGGVVIKPGAGKHNINPFRFAHMLENNKFDWLEYDEIYNYFYNILECFIELITKTELSYPNETNEFNKFCHGILLSLHEKENKTNQDENMKYSIVNDIIDIYDILKPGKIVNGLNHPDIINKLDSMIGDAVIDNNHISNLFVYDVSEIEESLKPIVSLFVLADIWGQVYNIHEKSKYSCIYLDNFDVFVENPPLIDYAYDIWKRARLFGCTLTASLSNCSPNILTSENISLSFILNHSSFKLLFGISNEFADRFSFLADIKREKFNFLCENSLPGNMLFLAGDAKEYIAFQPMDSSVIQELF